MDVESNGALPETNDSPPNNECSSVESLEAEKTESPESLSHWQDQIASKLTEFQVSTEKTLSELLNVVKSRLSYDETKERAFDRLYLELEQSKQSGEFERMRPLFTDLILLFDRIDHLSIESSETDEISPIVKSILDELIEILTRRGVEFTPPTEYFDPAFQHALGTEETKDPEDNNRISRVIRRGFRFESRVLRHEEVFVYRYEPGGSGSVIENSKIETQIEKTSPNIVNN